MSSREVSRQTKVLYSSTKGKSNLIETLNDNNEQYLERMAALKNFRSKSKKATATRTQIQDWAEEQQDLIKMLDKTEKSKTMQLQALVVAGVDAGVIQSILEEEGVLASERSQLRFSYRSQIDQVKKFLTEQTKQLNKLRNNRPSASEGAESEGGVDRRDLVISGVCADMFLQLRSKFHDAWSALKAEEAQCRREVASFQQRIQSMLRDDAVETQNNQLHLEVLGMIRNSERAFSTTNNPAENESVREHEEPSVTSSEGSMTLSGKKSMTNAKAQSVSIPDDDPDLLNLVADITQEIQVIDEESAKLTSSKTSELYSLSVELGINAASTPKAAVSMYEELDGDGQLPSYTEAVASPRPSQSSAVHPFGGWTQDSHETFVKIYRNAELKGLKRSKMLEQLQLALSSSGVTNEDLMTHEEWYRKMRLIQKKFKAAEQSLQVRRQEAISQAKFKIEQFISDYQAKAALERDLQRQEENRQRLHEELEKMREERRIANEQKLLAMQATEAEERAKLEEKMRQDEEERIQKKQLIEEYQRQKALMEAERLKHQQEEQMKAQARLQELIAQNKGRVEYRAQQEAQKLVQKKQREEEALQQEAKKLEFLNALAAQVPYYDAIQQVESRLDHVTASAKAQEYIPIGEEDRLTRGHMPLNSFNDHQIVRDARFRLSEALSRAGVQYSDAARVAVANMNPRPHLAIHGLL